MNSRSIKKKMKYCCMLWINCTWPQGVPEMSNEQCLSYSEEENVDARSHVGVESFIYVTYFFRNDSLLHDIQNRIPLIKLKLTGHLCNLRLLICLSCYLRLRSKQTQIMLSLFLCIEKA
jgi:hypothetical protein